MSAYANLPSGIRSFTGRNNMANNRTQTLLKGISIQTLITLVMGVIEVVYFAIMSRLLTKSDFGYFAVISGVMAICMSLSEAGLGSAIIQKKDASKSYISTTFTLSLILGSIFFFAVFFLSPYISYVVADNTVVIPLKLTSVTILLNSIISVGNAVLYKKLDFKRVGLNSVVAYLCSSIIAIVMAYYGYGLFAIVTANILNSLFLVILLYGFSIRIPKIKIYKAEINGIVSFGGWLTLGVVLNNFSHQLDKLVLTKWLSVEALGAYNRPAGFISTISTKINGIFDAVLFPMLSDLQDNREKVREVFLDAISLLNGFSIILAAIFFFNAHLIICIFFGEQWLDMVPIMQIVSIGIIFNIDGRLVDCFFRSLAYVRLGAILRGLSVIITLCALYIGSRYGLYGVAVSIVVANVINIFVKIFCLSYKTNVQICDILKRMLIAWRPIIPILVVGTPYLIMNNHTWLLDLCFASMFAIIIGIEFVVYPNFVGSVYTYRVYPMIAKMKYKLFKR